MINSEVDATQKAGGFDIDEPVPTFTLEIQSTYKDKKLGFLCINGINTVAF